MVSVNSINLAAPARCFSNNQRQAAPARCFSNNQNQAAPARCFSNNQNQAAPARCFKSLVGKLLGEAGKVILNSETKSTNAPAHDIPVTKAPAKRPIPPQNDSKII